MKIATSFMLLFATAASVSAAEHSGIRGPSAVAPVVADDTFEDFVLIQATAKPNDDDAGCRTEGGKCHYDNQCCDSNAQCRWVNGYGDGICTSKCSSTGQMCHNNRECCGKFCDWGLHPVPLVGRCTWNSRGCYG